MRAGSLQAYAWLLSSRHSRHPLSVVASQKYLVSPYRCIRNLGYRHPASYSTPEAQRIFFLRSEWCHSSNDILPLLLRWRKLDPGRAYSDKLKQFSDTHDLLQKLNYNFSRLKEVQASIISDMKCSLEETKELVHALSWLDVRATSSECGFGVVTEIKVDVDCLRNSMSDYAVRTVAPQSCVDLKSRICRYNLLV